MHVLQVDAAPKLFSNVNRSGQCADRLLSDEDRGLCAGFRNLASGLCHVSD